MAQQSHDYHVCRDQECFRRACEAWKEGRALARQEAKAAYNEGFDEGYGAGFAAGFAAGAAEAG